MKPLLPFLLFLVFAVGIAADSMAQQPDVRRTVSVRGEGRVMVEPDMVTVRFGVVTRADDAETARRLNDEAAARSMNAVRNLGIAERKIRMEVLQLNERREYDPQTRRHEVRGFEATRVVSVELEDIDRLPELVTYVVQEGANRLMGIHYDVQDREAIRNQALEQAVRNGRQKAALMVRTLDATLGPVITLSEDSFDFPRPRPEMMIRVAADEAAPAPDAYAAGEMEVRAVVSVQFEIR